MYYGKVTEELKTLYKQYYDKFGVEPDFYEELEYSYKWSYKEFIRDIKEAIRLNIELPSLPWLVSDDEDECDLL